MKFNNKLIALALGAMSLSFAACDNQDIEFPDHQDGIAVYFPYQKPAMSSAVASCAYSQVSFESSVNISITVPQVSISRSCIERPSCVARNKNRAADHFRSVALNLFLTSATFAYSRSMQISLPGLRDIRSMEKRTQAICRFPAKCCHSPSQAGI